MSKTWDDEILLDDGGHLAEAGAKAKWLFDHRRKSSLQEARNHLMNRYPEAFGARGREAQHFHQMCMRFKLKYIKKAEGTKEGWSNIFNLKWPGMNKVASGLSKAFTDSKKCLELATGNPALIIKVVAGEILEFLREEALCDEAGEQFLKNLIMKHPLIEKLDNNSTARDLALGILKALFKAIS